MANPPTGPSKIVHEFTPPDLDDSNIGQRILCVRPMKKGSLDLEIKTHIIDGHEKHVISTSGFGGSGITLGEGAVDYQLERFGSQVLPKLRRDKETPITVVGAGYIGSLTALKLQEQGYKNVYVVAESLTETCSHNAGGLIAPVSMANDPEGQILADKFGVSAYQSFLQSLKGEHPFIQADDDRSVMIVPSYWANREDSGLEPYVNAGVMQPAYDVTLNMQDTDVSHDLVCYGDGIFVNTPSVMKQLHHKLFTINGTSFTQRTVTSFGDLSSSVIFNCTGVQAADMAERTSLKDQYVPTLGHLLMIQDQTASSKTLGAHNSMILTYGGESTTPFGHQCTDSFYMFPKHYGPYQAVLGGTFIEGVGLKDGKLVGHHQYPEKFNTVLKNGRRFFGIEK